MSRASMPGTGSACTCVAILATHAGRRVCLSRRRAAQGSGPAAADRAAGPARRRSFARPARRRGPDEGTRGAGRARPDPAAFAGSDREALYLAEHRVAAAQFAAQGRPGRASRSTSSTASTTASCSRPAAATPIARARRPNACGCRTSARDEEEAQRAEAERDAQQQQAAGIASDESDQARALAEARAKEAALAQQEAALSGAAALHHASDVVQRRAARTLDDRRGRGVCPRHIGSA